MDTQSHQELERFYGLALSATATTHFYNAVYQYIAYVKQSHLISHILEEDDKEMHIYDLEKSRTVPKRQEGENEHYQFVKEMRHMNSGEHFFVSHLYFLLTHHIYDLLDWYFAENFQSEEASIMLNGRKKYNAISRWWRHRNRHNIIGYDSTDYNKMYIDNFQDWKKILINFQTLLLKKVDTFPLQAVVPTKKEIILELFSDGNIMYRGKTGNLSPGREYKLLYRLVLKHGKTVSHNEIARRVYIKKDTEVLRMQMPDLVRKLKNKILKVTGEDASNLVKSNRQLGYFLNLQENEEAKILP